MELNGYYPMTNLLELQMIIMKKQFKKFLKSFMIKGDIYKGHYEGLYCTPCESFFTETQLVDGKCPDCGRPVEVLRKKHIFSRQSKYADRLNEIY